MVKIKPLKFEFAAYASFPWKLGTPTEYNLGLIVLLSTNQNWVIVECSISSIIVLLTEKFLELHWLRSDTFSLIIVTMVTGKNLELRGLRAGYEKWRKDFHIFEIQQIQELIQNSENRNNKKSASTWLNVWTTGPKNY